MLSEYANVTCPHCGRQYQGSIWDDDDALINRPWDRHRDHIKSSPACKAAEDALPQLEDPNGIWVDEVAG